MQWGFHHGLIGTTIVVERSACGVPGSHEDRVIWSAQMRTRLLLMPEGVVGSSGEPMHEIRGDSQWHWRLQA